MACNGPGFYRRQIDKNTTRWQRRQLLDNLLSHMNRYADNHHSGISNQLRRTRPVIFLQRPHLVARQRQHFFKQPPHLATAAHDHYRTQRRAQSFKAFVVFAGVRLPHDATQHIFNQIGRYAQRSRFFAA